MISTERRRCEHWLHDVTKFSDDSGVHTTTDNTARFGVTRVLATILCVLGIPVMVLVLVRVLFGAPITAYRPLISDEVTYWHQAFTFSVAGFHGGYYTLDEVTNPSGVTPFGPHGPGFPVLYGLAGKVVGWHRYSVVMLHLIALAIAGGVWASVSRVSVSRLFLTGLMLVTFWHVLFWAPTGMQEPLHHAGAIVMAAFFAAALGPSARPWTTISGWIVLAALSLIRPSWVLLMPLWAFATTRSARWPTMLGMLAVSAACAAAALVAFSRIVAPYSSGVFSLLAMSTSPGLAAIADSVSSNLARLSQSDQFVFIEILHRYQYVACALVASAATVICAWKEPSALRKGPAAHFLVAAAAMAGAAAAMLLLYEFTSFAEHRVLSAFLLFGLLLCVAAPGRIGPLLVVCLILSNLASANVSLRTFEASRRDHFTEDTDALRLSQAIDGKVAYREDLSRWCNTLLTSRFPTDLIAIPPGIGLSVLQNPERIVPRPRSRYLLLDESALAAFRSPLNVDPIVALPYGTLYVNRDADCDGQR